MRLKNNSISNTHHKLVLMDLDHYVASYIQKERRANLSMNNYVEEAKDIVPTLNPSIVEYCLNREDHLENIVILDEYDEDAELFPNSYLLPDPLLYLDEDDELMKGFILE